MGAQLVDQKKFSCMAVGCVAFICFMLIYQLFQEVHLHETKLEQIQHDHDVHVTKEHRDLDAKIQIFGQGLDKMAPLHQKVEHSQTELTSLKQAQADRERALQQHVQELNERVKHFEQEIEKFHVSQEEHVQTFDSKIQHFDEEISKIQKMQHQQSENQQHKSKEHNEELGHEKKKSTKAISLPPWHIFQIGFHKCGTNSLHKFFQLNGVPSVHNQDFNGKHQDISLFHHLMTAYNQELPILSDLGVRVQYTFFADFGVHTSDGVPWYKIIAEQYPDSKYIINIKSVYEWLKSRYVHIRPDGTFMIDSVKASRFPNYGKWNLSESQEMRFEAKILRSWKREWYQYLCGAFDFFLHQHPELRENMIVIDVEMDQFDKLVGFLESFDFSLDDKGLRFEGEMVNKQLIQPQLGKWDVLTKRYAEFAGDLDAAHTFENEYERLAYVCSMQFDVSFDLQETNLNAAPQQNSEAPLFNTTATKRNKDRKRPVEKEKEKVIEWDDDFDEPPEV